MRRAVWWLGALLTLSPLASALQARDLISDAEDMLRVLRPQDPERLPVTLRLADLLFDAAIEIDADAKTGRDGARAADRYRERSAVLYREALPKLKSEQALRVKFQLARLHSFKAEIPAAIKQWREIVETPGGDARLRRESALHLAEQLELSNDMKSIREASALYERALPLADKDSLRSYIIYRTAWTEYRMGDAAKASRLMQKSLELAVDKERDELLKDLVLFLSRSEGSAKEQIALIERLEKKYGKAGYVDQLSEAYLAADRRADYAASLLYLNKIRPGLARGISILDSSQDSMSVREIERALNKLIDLRRSGVAFKSPEEVKVSKDKLFRLVHLWDGNRRAGKAEYTDLIATGVSSMILLFPEAEETAQAMGGWLSAQTDPKLQRPQVERWIGYAREVHAEKLEISLTKTQLELARQLKDWPAVVAVSDRLEVLTASATRPMRYQKAKALYELKQYDQALPLFLSLAAAPGPEKEDLQRLSQDLALDVLAIRKDYAQIVALTAQWKSPDQARAAEFAAIGEKAKFEGAVAAEDASALTTFTQFCLEKKFTPKSCDNARNLAGKLRNQGTLITVLKAQGDEKELTRQLEVAGRFGESARLMEKSLAGSTELMPWLKVALLFELQGELKERDRVLNRVVHDLEKRKLTDQEQTLVYATLKDANLLSDKLFALSWSSAMRLQLAEALYDANKSKVAADLLSKSCDGGGPGWQSLHLRSLREINERQAKIQFTGARSKRKFEERVAQLKLLGERANCFKQGAPPESAKAASLRVSQAYTDFADQIRNTPIPDGLDEETLKEVRAQIETMASPFEKQAGEWRGEADRIVVAQGLPEGWNFDAPKASKAMTPPVAFDWQPLISDIQKEPFVRGHFEQLQAHFEAKGQRRLASYVKGRLEDMGGGVQ